MIVGNYITEQCIAETLDFVLISPGQYDFWLAGDHDGAADVRFQHVTPDGVIDLAPPFTDVLLAGRTPRLQPGQYRLYVERRPVVGRLLSLNFDLRLVEPEG
jgi:hypothetical protein